MSRKCECGHFRVALVSTMCFLFFLNLLFLKHVRRNNGIGRVKIGSLQCESLQQSLRDTDFCISKGAQYFCTYVNGKLNLFSADQQNPVGNCLSEQESRVGCRGGKYLCKDGIAAIIGPSISPSLNPPKQVRQCLDSTTTLRAGEICFFKNVPYVCTDNKPENVATDEDRSQQCIEHIAANIACSEESFLCKKSSGEPEAVGGWAQYTH